jgi:putative ABC transport system permease protein
VRSTEALAALGVRRSRLRTVDLLVEGILSISRNIGRSMATAVGTVLGTAAFVATLGLSSTMEQQVSASFDVRRATEVVVQPVAKDLNGNWQGDPAMRRLHRLNGVVAAGPRVMLPQHRVRRTRASADVSLPLMGADPGALAVMAPHLVAGRRYDAFHESRTVPVVMLSSSLARQLSIGRVGVAVFIEDVPYVVIGIFDDVQRRPEALLSVVMPFSVASRIGVAPGAPEPDRDVVVQTAPGAAQLIGGQAALALHPEGADALQAIAPPDPRLLRREVEASVTRSSFILSIIALVIGTISIGNAATAAVAARTGEIGLRRAIGSRPRHIFLQLITETTVLGCLGGTIGALAGMVITAGVSVWQQWQPVIDVTVAAEAVAAGAVAGLLAGLWPAVRATRVQPAIALQR